MTSEIEYKEAKILAESISEFLDTKIISEQCPSIPILKVDIVKEIPENTLEECLKLLDLNLGKVYETVNGRKWRISKREEMLEPGLVYVLFRLKETGKLLGFLSVKIINEIDFHLLYLYEIQLDPRYRNLRFGSFLMRKLEEIVKSINESGKVKKLWYKNFKEDYDDINDPNLLLTGIGLTVFSVNKGARKLYQRFGYKLHHDSETDKVLRNGKIIEPDYYMLEKQIK